jgi:hypothetical protein
MVSLEKEYGSQKDLVYSLLEEELRKWEKCEMIMTAR